jgi:hypothetical protein
LTSCKFGGYKIASESFLCMSLCSRMTNKERIELKTCPSHISNVPADPEPLYVQQPFFLSSVSNSDFVNLCNKDSRNKIQSQGEICRDEFFTKTVVYENFAVYDPNFSVTTILKLLTPL